MRIEKEVSGGVRILRLAGEIDAMDVPELADTLRAASAQGAVPVVLNLENVRFVTAAVLGCLIEARARAREQAGDVVLIAPSRFVEGVLRVLRLDRLLEVHRTERDAMGRLHARDRAASSPAA